MALTASGFARLFAIRAAADPDNPDYTAILAAEQRFITPLLERLVIQDRLPSVLRFSRPANDIEEAVQHLAVAFVGEMTDRPIDVEYTSAPPSDFELRRRQRVACLRVGIGWRIASRLSCRTAGGAARAPSSREYCRSARIRSA